MLIDKSRACCNILIQFFKSVIYLKFFTFRSLICLFFATVEFLSVFAFEPPCGVIVGPDIVDL